MCHFIGASERWDSEEPCDQTTTPTGNAQNPRVGRSTSRSFSFADMGRKISNMFKTSRSDKPEDPDSDHNE